MFVAETFGQITRLLAADLVAVEADVVVGATVEREPVVVDRRDLPGVRGVDGRLAAVGIDARDDQNLDAAVDHVLGNLDEVRRVTLRVLDLDRYRGVPEGGLQVLRVGGAPTLGTGRVG